MKFQDFFFFKKKKKYFDMYSASIVIEYSKRKLLY